MSLTRNIAHNTIIQFGGKIIGMVIGLVTFSMMAGYLHDDGVGGYTTIISFLSIFGILADMGLYIILVKQISEKGADEETIVANVFAFRLVIAAVILAFAPLLAMLPIFPYPHAVRVGIAIGTLSFLFISLNQLLVGVFQRHMRMDKVAIGEVLGRVALFAGTFLAIRLNSGLVGIVIAIVSGSFLNFLYVFIAANKHVRIRLGFDFKVWKHVLFLALPVAISVVLNLIYLKVGAVFLSVFKTQSEVGVFGAPFKILEIIVTFPAIFAGLLTPPLAEKHSAGDKEKFVQIYRKAFDALAIIVFPMVIGIAWYAKQIMVLIRADFPGTDVVLRILIFAIAMIFFSNLFGNTIVAIERQKNMIWGYFVTAVLAVIANYFFIQAYSSVGAAFSTVISESLIAFFAAFVIYRYTKIIPSFRVFFKALLCGLIMLGVCAILPFKNMFVGGMIGLIVYVCAMVVVKGITPDVITEIVRLRRGQHMENPIELGE